MLTNESTTYADFKNGYAGLIKTALTYTTDQAGSNIYASKLADFTDPHPVWTERADIELEKEWSDTYYNTKEG